MDLYTCGIWTVKPGMEKDFIQAWEVFAKWTSQHVKGGGNGILLQDAQKSNLFISVGPWESNESIGKWRSTPEFNEFFEQAKTLCDDIRPGTYNVVAQST